MDVRVGLWRRLSAEELVLLNCGAGEDSWESFGQQEDPTSPSKRNQSWIFIGRTVAEAETPILWPPDVKCRLFWKDLDAWKDWGQERWERQQMRWFDGITDSMDWVWVNSGSWWWTGRPGMLWFIGSQRARHNWVTELNRTEGFVSLILINFQKINFHHPNCKMRLA